MNTINSTQVFARCYDQSLGETLVQHECETSPPLPILQAPAAVAFLNGFINKHGLYTILDAGRLGQWRRASRRWEEPAFKLLSSRQEPISSRGDNLQSQTHLQPISHTHTHTLPQVKRDIKNRQTFVTSRVTSGLMHSPLFQSKPGPFFWKWWAMFCLQIWSFRSCVTGV